MRCNPQAPEFHCLRSNGTERAWFLTLEDAQAFERDPRNVNYHGDVAHFCGKCGFYHLSRPEWLGAADKVWIN